MISGSGWKGRKGRRLGGGALRAKLGGEAMGAAIRPRHFFARRLVNAGG